MEDTTNQSAWDRVAEAMLEGIRYGKFYSNEFLEEGLGVNRDRDSLGFDIAVSKVRERLEKHGYYLSGQGQKGKGFVIVPAKENIGVIKSYNRQALKMLKRGQILGSTTRTRGMSAEDRLRLESITAKTATRYILMKRSGQVEGHLSKTKPGMLQ